MVLALLAQATGKSTNILMEKSYDKEAFNDTNFGTERQV
jgi:hypothetical protein